MSGSSDFYDKSLSEHTRRAYRRVIREFFTAHREKHPSEITAKQLLAWRDALIRKRPILKEVLLPAQYFCCPDSPSGL